mgnify:CR=1 FL=1
MVQYVGLLIIGIEHSFPDIPVIHTVTLKTLFGTVINTWGAKGTNKKAHARNNLLGSGIVAKAVLKIHPNLVVVVDIGHQKFAILATVKGKKAVYHFKGDEIYVRAKITASNRVRNPRGYPELQSAWVQPVRPRGR